jgi:hypothetical protein
LNNQFGLRNELNFDAEKVLAPVTSAEMFEVVNIGSFEYIDLLKKGALI